MRRVPILLLVAVPLCAQETTPGRPHVHVPTVRTLSFDCPTAQRAAKSYFETRSIKVSEWPFKPNDWRACKEDECWALGLQTLRSTNGTVLTWQEKITEYTWPRPKAPGTFYAPEEGRMWSRGWGYWETAGKWDAAGSLTFLTKDTRCFVRVDFYFGRGITQFLLIFPIDRYNDEFVSNDKLESEVVSGIAPLNGIGLSLGQAQVKIRVGRENRGGIYSRK